MDDLIAQDNSQVSNDVKPVVPQAPTPQQPVQQQPPQTPYSAEHIPTQAPLKEEIQTLIPIESTAEVQDNPEAPPVIPEVVSAPETAPTKETAPIAEVAPSVETQKPPETQQKAPPTEPVAQEIDDQTPPENVVDLRTGHEKLQRVAETADSTTTQADQDEQEFIEEVEKHHGTN